MLLYFLEELLTLYFKGVKKYIYIKGTASMHSLREVFQCPNDFIIDGQYANDRICQVICCLAVYIKLKVII